MTTEQDQRAAVATEALSWLGTPYHYHARLKGVGVDCLQLLCGVFEACGLVPHIDPGQYSQSWHLHRSEELYATGLAQYVHKLPDGQVPQVGDIALLRFGRTYSHAGIYADACTLVHSYVGRGVIISRLSEEPLAHRPLVAYSLWGAA